MNRPAPAHRVDPSVLTPREREVWTLALAGLGRREIAHRLNITVGTVSTRLGIAREKVGAQEP